MMSSQQQLQLSSKDEQQSDATPSMAKNDPPSPITKSISVSSHKLLDDCKTSVEELLGDAETVDRGECTVTEHSHGLPRRLILPEEAAGVPKFGSWDELNPSSDDGFTSIFNKAGDSKRTGIETSGGDDSEPPPPRRGTTSSGNCSNESMHGGQDAQPRKATTLPKFGDWEDEYAGLNEMFEGGTSANVDSTLSGDDGSETRKATTLPKFGDLEDEYGLDGGNQIYFENLWREGSEKDRPDPESIKQPGPSDTKPRPPSCITTIRGKRKRNDVFTTGNQIYFENLWREGSEKDRSAPESVKQPSRPTDTKRHRWYNQLWRIKR